MIMANAMAISMANAMAISMAMSMAIVKTNKGNGNSNDEGNFTVVIEN
ncbi:hypothetical protein [Flavobacterium sp.]|jgi:hypothetical protein